MNWPECGFERNAARGFSRGFEGAVADSGLATMDNMSNNRAAIYARISCRGIL